MILLLKYYLCLVFVVDVFECLRVWACSGGIDGGIVVWFFDDVEVVVFVCVIECVY